MDLSILIFIVLAVSSVSAFLIARKIMSMLTAQNNKWAAVIAIISFVTFFLIILFLLAMIILSNMDFGR